MRRAHRETECSLKEIRLALSISTDEKRDSRGKIDRFPHIGTYVDEFQVPEQHAPQLVRTGISR